MALNLSARSKKLLPFLIRVIAVLSRISIIVLLPKLLDTKNFNLYSLFTNLIMYSSTISGLGLPVFFIKKFALGEVNSHFYLRYITPISVLSGILFFLISLLFFPVKVEFSYILILSIILIGEIIISEYLRLYQAKSFLKKHVYVSLIKSFTLLVVFLILGFLLNNKNVLIILLSWVISNLVSIFYIRPNLYKIIKVKISDKIFTKSVVAFSSFYFVGYLIDRSALYYDKVFFYQSFDQASLKKLNILILVLQSSFNLIESTFLLNIYNKVFNHNFFFSRQSKFKYGIYLIAYTFFTTIFVCVFYKNLFLADLFKLFFVIIFYFLFSIFSWFNNLRNYSSLSSIKYLTVSSSIAIFYVLIVVFMISLKVDIFIIPLLYPIVSSVVQKLSRYHFVYEN